MNMRTMILKTINTNEFDGISAYCVLEIDNASLAFLEDKFLLFSLIPREARPTYMVWLGVTLVDWINGLELERFLEDIGLDSEEWREKIDACDVGVLLPGKQDRCFDKNAYRTPEDPELEQFTTDLEQVCVSSDREVYFSCNLNDSNQGLEIRSIKIEELEKALRDQAGK